MANKEHISISSGTLVARGQSESNMTGSGQGRTGKRSSWNKGVLVDRETGKAIDEPSDMDNSALRPTEKTPTVTEDPDDNIPFSSLAFLKYMDAVGGIESNNRYDIVGGYNNHYQGRFQMSKAALRDVGIGFTKADREKFLSDPDAQDEAMEQFTLQNHNYLKARSEKYRSMTDREKLGILGYAHNQGRGGALRFLETGQSEADGFGTDAQVYIEKVNKALS